MVRQNKRDGKSATAREAGTQDEAEGKGGFKQGGSVNQRSANCGLFSQPTTPETNQRTSDRPRPTNQRTHRRAS